MTPYHYSIVQCRDLAYQGERRNVGLLVVSPTLGKAWLRRAGLKQRAHLVGDDAAFVKALLDGLLEEAGQVAREGSAATTHGWLRSRSRPSEDSLTLTAPAVGIAEDMKAEVGRLREAYLGRAGGGARTAAEKVRDSVLGGRDLHAAFVPRAFDSGPATWRFPAVAELGDTAIVFNALTFRQRTPEGILDATFRNVGRVQEVQHSYPNVQWLTIADGPANDAFRRSRELMTDAGLRVIPPNPARVVVELTRLGLLANHDEAAEA